MKVDIELLKCSLVVGILFFVFSHPYLYRLLHKQFHKVMSFVDDRMCPTEGGVLVHAVIFGLVIYFGKKLYEKHNPPKKAPSKPVGTHSSKWLSYKINRIIFPKMSGIL